MGLDKTVASAAVAVSDVGRRARRIAVGGFGLCGVPSVLIDALLEQGTTGLRVVSNNCGVDDWGLGVLLSAPAGSRRTIELVRRREQGVRAAVPVRRAGGRADPAGHPRRAAAGRRLRHPGVLHRRPGSARRSPTAACPGATHPTGRSRWRRRPRRSASSTGARTCWRRRSATDFALVRAAVGDRHGNLVFHETARNFNPLAAMAGRVTIAEVERAGRAGRARSRTGSTCPGSSCSGSSRSTSEQASAIERIARPPHRAGRRPDMTLYA